MERIDIFHQLLETDRRAKEQFADAKHREAGLTEYLEAQLAEMRARYYASANEEISDIEAQVIKMADTDIARQDKWFRDRLASVDLRRKQYREQWIQRIFNMATCQKYGEDVGPQS